jgi:SsrA-binding protein
MILIKNKKADFDYSFQRTLHAGVVLTGGEVKSIRKQSGSLVGSFVKVIGNEVFLLNAQITPYAYADNREYDPKRTRKLLLHRREIADLQVASEQKGISLIPIAFELAGRNIKVLIGVGRGKKQFEKRAVIKARDLAREERREL